DSAEKSTGTITRLLGKYATRFASFGDKNVNHPTLISLTAALHDFESADRQDKDFAVTHPAGVCDLAYTLDNFGDAGVIDPGLDFNLRQKRQRVLGLAVFF